MGEYTERDLDNVRGGMDPRFVSTNIPEEGMQVDELTEEQLMNIFGGIPYEYAAELAQENEAAFRAAAVEQLVIWGERVGVPVVKQQMGSDPASVAFDTIKSAVANNADVVIIDTAGRLHNKVGLMNELTKIKNVMKKVSPTAPDEVLLVLDGSTGQNAYEQAKQFTKATDITSLAITKLDGTAKGGVVIGISHQLNVPVKYIGLGEKMTDLQPFNRKEFVESLFENSNL
jgi:fused signal recognition particle receptor